MNKFLALLAGALLSVSGCGHGGVSEQAGEAKDTVSASFDQAYQSVKSGAQSTARFGGYIIDRTSQGMVRVYRAARQGVTGAGENMSDAYVTAKVKGRLATDRDVNSHNIEVDTDTGVVTLRGTVRDPHEATRAVQDALTTSGVFAVNSELSWPTLQSAQPPPPAM